MNRSEIISTIKNYFIDKPVKEVYIFGSFARNEAKYNDIDVLVDIDYSSKISMFDFVDMKLDLEEKIGEKIDLVSVGGLSQRIKPYIDIDKQLLLQKNG
jgi:predicted nucleotidyltransferase